MMQTACVDIMSEDATLITCFPLQEDTNAIVLRHISKRKGINIIAFMLALEKQSNVTHTNKKVVLDVPRKNVVMPKEIAMVTTKEAMTIKLKLKS